MRVWEYESNHIHSRTHAAGFHYKYNQPISHSLLYASLHSLISDTYSYEKIHTALLVRRDGLISAHVTTKPSPRLGLDVVTCPQMNPSRLPNDAAL